MPFLGVPLLGREGSGFITIAGGTAPSPPLPPTVNAPVITSPDHDSGVAGSSYQYQIVATNNPTSFGAIGLPPGLSINTTGRISGTLPATAGTHTIELRATNAGGTGTRDLDLTVTTSLQVPVINSATTLTRQVGNAIGYTITATHSPTHFAATNLPSGISVNATTGALTGNLTTQMTNHVIGLEATNAAGTGHENLSLTVHPATPVVTNPGAKTWHVGTPITDVHVSATNNPTSYAATNLPAGVTINTTTGIISGTPIATGTHTVGLTATNAGGTSAVVNMSVTVHPAVPVVAPSQTINATIGTALTPTYQIVASNNPTSYARTGDNNWPAGMSMSTAGVVSGTPTPGSASAGNHTVHVTATNAGGTSASESITVHLTAQPVPVVTAGALTRTHGTGWTHQIVATNGPMVSYSISGQPSGVSVNTTTGLITGTTAVPVGVHTIVMHATNHTGQSAAANLVVTIEAIPIPVVTAGSLTRTFGTAWTHQIVATNLSHTPISYQISGQPAGVTVNSTSGLISGTSAVAEGVHHITMHCTNAGGQSAGAALTVTIDPAPVIDVSPVVHIANSASPPTGPHEFFQLWVRSNSNALAYWSGSQWLLTQAGG